LGGISAILDRILHHSTNINIKGNSYRLEEKVKVGLIRVPEDETKQHWGDVPAQNLKILDWHRAAKDVGPFLERPSDSEMMTRKNVMNLEKMAFRS
jgi:hypothetical protein